MDSGFALMRAPGMTVAGVLKRRERIGKAASAGNKWL